MDLTWNDVKGLFLRLAPEKQLKFVIYLRSMQDNEGSSEPQAYDFLEDPQSNA